MDNKIDLITEMYGLEFLMEQNDISEFDVVKMLVERNLIDIEDYFFTDTDLSDEEDLYEV